MNIQTIKTSSQVVGYIWTSSSGRIFYSRVDRESGWYPCKSIGEAKEILSQVCPKLELKRQYGLI